MIGSKVDIIKSRPVIHNGNLSWAFTNHDLLKYLVRINRYGSYDHVLSTDSEKVGVIPLRNFFKKGIKLRCQYEKVESYSIKNLRTPLTTSHPNIQNPTLVNFGAYKDEHVIVFHSISHYVRIRESMNEDMDDDDSYDEYLSTPLSNNECLIVFLKADVMKGSMNNYKRIPFDRVKMFEECKHDLNPYLFYDDVINDNNNENIDNNNMSTRSQRLVTETPVGNTIRGGGVYNHYQNNSMMSGDTTTGCYSIDHGSHSINTVMNSHSNTNNSSIRNSVDYNGSLYEPLIQIPPTVKKPPHHSSLYSSPFTRIPSTTTATASIINIQARPDDICQTTIGSNQLIATIAPHIHVTMTNSASTTNVTTDTTTASSSSVAAPATITSSSVAATTTSAAATTTGSAATMDTPVSQLAQQWSQDREATNKLSQSSQGNGSSNSNKSVSMVQRTVNSKTMMRSSPTLSVNNSSSSSTGDYCNRIKFSATDDSMNTLCIVPTDDMTSAHTNITAATTATDTTTITTSVTATDTATATDTTTLTVNDIPPTVVQNHAHNNNSIIITPVVFDLKHLFDSYHQNPTRGYIKSECMNLLGRYSLVWKCVRRVTMSGIKTEQLLFLPPWTVARTDRFVGKDGSYFCIDDYNNKRSSSSATNKNNNSNNNNSNNKNSNKNKKSDEKDEFQNNNNNNNNQDDDDDDDVLVYNLDYFESEWNMFYYIYQELFVRPDNSVYHSTYKEEDRVYGDITVRSVTGAVKDLPGAERFSHTQTQRSTRHCNSTEFPSSITSVTGSSSSSSKSNSISTNISNNNILTANKVVMNSTNAHYFNPFIHYLLQQRINEETAYDEWIKKKELERIQKKRIVSRNNRKIQLLMPQSSDTTITAATTTTAATDDDCSGRLTSMGEVDGLMIDIVDDKNSSNNGHNSSTTTNDDDNNHDDVDDQIISSTDKLFLEYIHTRGKSFYLFTVIWGELHKLGWSIQQASSSSSSLYDNSTLLYVGYWCINTTATTTTSSNSGINSNNDTSATGNRFSKMKNNVVKKMFNNDNHHHHHHTSYMNFDITRWQRNHDYFDSKDELLKFIYFNGAEQPSDVVQSVSPVPVIGCGSSRRTATGRKSFDQLLLTGEYDKFSSGVKKNKKRKLAAISSSSNSIINNSVHPNTSNTNTTTSNTISNTTTTAINGDTTKTTPANTTAAAISTGAPLNFQQLATAERIHALSTCIPSTTAATVASGPSATATTAATRESNSIIDSTRKTRASIKAITHHSNNSDNSNHNNTDNNSSNNTHDCNKKYTASSNANIINATHMSDMNNYTTAATGSNIVDINFDAVDMNQLLQVLDQHEDGGVDHACGSGLQSV